MIDIGQEQKNLFIVNLIYLCKVCQFVVMNRFDILSPRTMPLNYFEA